MEKFMLLLLATQDKQLRLFKTILKRKLQVLSTLILFATCHTAKTQSINIPGPSGSGQFGATVTLLTNGNYVVTDPLYDDGAVTDVGAVYLYNGSTHALISTLKGSTMNDQVGGNGITLLSNGNYVVKSLNWDNGGAADAGALTWCSAATGTSGSVSSSNSLAGTTTGDAVGNDGITALSNGNYVVLSTSWDNGAATNAGAVTWGNGTSGISGVLSSSNSLVGSTAGDLIGSPGITVLSNGNYVVRSYNWNNGAIPGAGAVTWGNGTIGISGVVSSTNSLVGSTAGDFIGNSGVAALNNGNYVVRSSVWDNGAATNVGAVTWSNGTTGITGVVSSSNSLVGSTPSDNVGNGGVFALSNGNYVVISTFWDNGAATNAGAVTWGNGTTGIVGGVSSSNSLVGSTSLDNVGLNGITVLGNGNYLVWSANWHNGAATNAGAMTWGNGTTGISGPVSSTNSLVGSTTGDAVGNFGVTTLSNGNYVVMSPVWDNGTATNAGAITWGNGTTGISGVVSNSNSLVGSTTGDALGNYGVTILANGNYVVKSPDWDNAATINAGAVTWGNGTTGITGAVSISNSLFGVSANDAVGSGGIVALSNGNYVVRSISWDNGAVTDAGAATWGNGTTGISGVVSSSNSLVGSTAGDAVSGYSIVILSNGNYIVGSHTWDNGAVSDAGAATWGNGTTGISGVVSSSNSLVGSTTGDGVGSGITSLSNGNYVVISSFWDNGAATNAGAVTWGNGTTGISGAVNSSNSLVGSTAMDFVGNFGIAFLSNGNYVVNSNSWDNGATSNVGAVTWANGTTGIAGVVSSSNSLVGSTANDGVGTGGINTLSNGNYVVKSMAWDNGATTNAGAVTLGNGTTGTLSFINSCNSVLGTTAGGGSSIVSTYNTVYNYLLAGRPTDNIVTAFYPSGMALANSLDAVTLNINGTNAVPLVASAGCRIIATLTPNGGASAINGTVNAKVWIEPSVPTYAVQPFVARHYEITPTTNAATATAKVTLYFTQQEFDDFNSDPGSFLNLPVNAGDVVGKSNLRVARYSGTSNNGLGLPGSYTPGALVIDPIDSDIIWNSTLSRWEVSFNVTGFGGFILQTRVYPLAVSLDFNGRLQNNNALLNWKTANEINTRSFVLERSIDGRNYAAVYNVAAFNTAGANQYNFTDPNITALNAAVIYYRLKQVGMDGRFSYSHIVALSPAGKNIVLLYPNPIQSEATLAITIGKTQQVQCRIIDNKGRIIIEKQYNLVTGSNALPVNVSRLAKGMYWLELKGETMNERKPFVKE